MTEPKPLVVVVGPTASGKSALSLSLAARLGGEVISADSVQIYRYFDIGSGKLTEAERGGIPHFGIDVLDPLDDVDASQFANLACQWIEEIRGRGRVPIVCGGTFLWIRALVYGLVPAPAKDDGIRESHREFAAAHGRAALHGRLAHVDKASSERLNPNDFVRVSRALEVFELTGVPLSEFHAKHGFAQRRHEPIYVGIDHGADLAGRIERRVGQMLDAGFEREVSSLCERGFRDARAMSSVGYRQVLSALESGSVKREELLTEIARATRVFSRRQRTWLREEAVTWLSPEQAATEAFPKALSSRFCSEG